MMRLVTKHPKCPECGGCRDHIECQIIKKGGCPGHKASRKR